MDNLRCFHRLHLLKTYSRIQIILPLKCQDGGFFNFLVYNFLNFATLLNYLFYLNDRLCLTSLSRNMPTAYLYCISFIFNNNSLPCIRGVSQISSKLFMTQLSLLLHNLRLSYIIAWAYSVSHKYLLFVKVVHPELVPWDIPK